MNTGEALCVQLFGNAPAEGCNDFIRNVIKPALAGKELEFPVVLGHMGSTWAEYYMAYHQEHSSD